LDQAAVTLDRQGKTDHRLRLRRFSLMAEDLAAMQVRLPEMADQAAAADSTTHRGE
jgi:hypothetical protein